MGIFMFYLNRKCASFLLIGASIVGFSRFAEAQSFTWTKANGTTSSSDSTILTSLGTNFENGGVLTIYASEVTTDRQFSGGNVGEKGTFTIQSAVPGSQVTIKTGGKYRFCDYAHGTYVLKDLYFKDCGTLSDGGGVFYRNGETGTSFKMDNVTIEGALGNSCSALRTYTGMTLSGTAVFKDNICSQSGGATVYVQASSGFITLEGDDSVMTFTGSKLNNGTVTYDLGVRGEITFKDAGTYSLGGGMNGATLKIDGAAVTLGKDSVSNFTGAAVIESGNLTLNSKNFTASSLTVNAGAALNLNASAAVSLEVNGSLNVGAADLTITNLSGSATGAIAPADGVASASLTLNNTKDTVFKGAVFGFDTITKTGNSEMKFTQSADADKFVLTGGKLSFDAAAVKIPAIDADVFLDKGATLYFYGSGNEKTSLLGSGSLYVGADGGVLQLATPRGYLSVQSEEGVQSGNLRLTGFRGFIVGTSTFNGYYEIVSGCTHFSNEALAKSKGIILNGGTLQYAGEIVENDKKEITAPIFLKDSSGITDLEGEDLTGTNLTVKNDTGYVHLTGSVNTKAILELLDAARTNGGNDVTFGGLSGSVEKSSFASTASADTGKSLILNVAASTAPVYSGSLTGQFLNLVKDGAGAQTFKTVGIGTESSPVASVTVNAGTLKMDSAPIYAKTLTVAKDGVLAFATGTHLIDAESLIVDGTMDIFLNSDGTSTKLNISTAADNFTANLEKGIFNLTFGEGDAPDSSVTWQIAEVFPDFGSDFDYDQLLSDSFRYEWNLSYSKGGLLLSIDNNAVPEPAGLTLMILGGIGLALARLRKKK